MKFTFSLLLCAFAFLTNASEFSTDFIPEASGVSRVGATLVIAGDEEPKALWLATDSGRMTHVKLSGASWDDMEGLASVDERFFFASTSHSRTKKGKRKPEREQLFLMELSEKKIRAVHTWSLRELVLTELAKSFGAQLDMKTVEGASPDEGGLNIEGLAYHGGKLFIGLRSPITAQGKALMLVIKNGNELLQGQAPLFEQTLSLDLAGKGIRGLDSTPQGLLVLSGSSSDATETFGLARFDVGQRTLSDFNIKGFENLLRPEGLVAELNGDVTVVQDFEQPETQAVLVRLNP